jgi:hypothetical protein
MRCTGIYSYPEESVDLCIGLNSSLAACYTSLKLSPIGAMHHYSTAQDKYMEQISQGAPYVRSLLSFCSFRGL